MNLSLKTNKNKAIALILLVISMLLIKNPLTKFPITFCVIIVFILISTFLQDKNLSSLNFKKLGFKEFKQIIISYLVFELVMDFIIQPIISLIFNEPADYSTFKSIEGNSALYIKWLFNMWISAAIGEELLFR